MAAVDQSYLLDGAPSKYTREGARPLDGPSQRRPGVAQGQSREAAGALVPEGDTLGFVSWMWNIFRLDLQSWFE